MKVRQVKVSGEIYKVKNLDSPWMENISFWLSIDSNQNLVIKSGGLVYTWNSEKQVFQNNRQDRFAKLHLPYGSLLRLIQ